MFWKKLITMILSALLCPVIICFLSGGISTVVNGFLSNAVSATKAVGTAEKEKRELTLPGRVVTVGNQSFVSCSNLKKVVYKSGGAAFADQNIEFKAFANTPLEEIHIPETVGIIGEYAIPESAKIYCASGSFAEEWAKRCEIKYVTE